MEWSLDSFMTNSWIVKHNSVFNDRPIVWFSSRVFTKLGNSHKMSSNCQKSFCWLENQKKRWKLKITFGESIEWDCCWSLGCWPQSFFIKSKKAEKKKPKWRTDPFECDYFWLLFVVSFFWCTFSEPFCLHHDCVHKTLVVNIHKSCSYFNIFHFDDSFLTLGSFGHHVTLGGSWWVFLLPNFVLFLQEAQTSRKKIIPHDFCMFPYSVVLFVDASLKPRLWLLV